MITIFEKEVETEEGISIVECEEKDATHIHYCYHDDDPNAPCKRVKI